MFKQIEKNILVNDKHLKVLESLSHFLKNSFANISISVSGSVARNEHNENSDIDLLLIGNNYKRDRQIILDYENIEINLLCLNIDYFRKRPPISLVNFEGQHINYILDSKSIFDSDNRLELLKSDAKAIKNQLLNNKKIQDSILFQLKRNYKKISFIKCLSLLISLKFLKNGIWFETKKGLFNSFENLQKLDYEFYCIVKEAISEEHSSDAVKKVLESFGN